MDYAMEGEALETAYSSFLGQRKKRGTFGSSSARADVNSIVDSAPRGGSLGTATDEMMKGKDEEKFGTDEGSPYRRDRIRLDDDDDSMMDLAGGLVVDDEEESPVPSADQNPSPTIVDDKALLVDDERNGDMESTNGEPGNEGVKDDDDSSSDQFESQACSLKPNASLEGDTTPESPPSELKGPSSLSADVGSDSGESNSGEGTSTASTSAPPSLPDLLKETKRLIRTVEDAEAVTAKHIYQSLEAKFRLQMNKSTKKSVKAHMIAVLEQLQRQQSSEKEEPDTERDGRSSSDDGESDDDDELTVSTQASDNGDEGSVASSASKGADNEDESDEEYASKKQLRKQQRASKKSSSQKTRGTKGGAADTSATKHRPPRRIKKDVRVKAMRIHAEALRKRRMEELRVRNEELQLECNQKDQKRAEEIAAKFDTNTEELRVKRLEQRVELLSKLDEKRMTVIQKDIAVELERSSSESGDDDDDDLELEGDREQQLVPTVHKSKALSLLDLADHRVCRHQLKKRVTKRTAASPSRSMNARAALKNSLVIKRRQQSNMWLARELGYKSEKEHLKECLEEEQRKKAAIRKMEQERLRRNQLLRERMLQGVEIVDDAGDDNEEAEFRLCDNEQAGEKDPVDDDEEMALAREIEEDTDRDNEPGESEAVEAEPGAAPDEDDRPPALHDAPNWGGAQTSSVETQPPEIVREVTLSEDADLDDNAEDFVDSGESPSPEDQDRSQQVTSMSEEVEENVSKYKDDDGPTPHDDPPKPKGPRNAVWKALLEKEAAQAMKLKANKSGWVEDEADEEEDEQVAGLEDFGFSIHKKKKDDDENDEDLNEGDLEDVVDDLSDNEGDEEAGEEARKAMELREEKERHKEMLRRMRDGYDGRRGGIAGGIGARGVHRFEQLVAADNREDAKRLGLLNDDEMDSDNEDGKTKSDGDDEEEDEGALLDKMLKDRFLHRSSVNIEEEFSDDDQSSDDEQVEKENEEDDDDKEQERLARRFAKRARMQRLIEAHGHEEEFSRSRLIDEDPTLKAELQKMKNGLARKRNSSALSSRSSSNGSTAPCKKQKGAAFAPGIALGGSLAIALQASRNHNQTRTTFVRSGSSGLRDERTVASFQKCISFGTVIFPASNSNSGFGREGSKMGQKGAHSLASRSGRQLNSATGSSKVSSGESLWSKAIAPGLQKPRS